MLSTLSQLIETLELENKAAHIPTPHKQEISFRQLSYSLPTNGYMKPILRNITARARPGKLTVVMGGSGSGKTTLLKVLGGRVNGGLLSGDIMVNGCIVTGRELSKASGFVYQDDVVMGTMTVKEVLEMSAQLRIPEGGGDRVEDILALMHLDKVAHVRMDRVSASERKRTCVAMELVTNPSILFLDSPVEGMGAVHAYRTMRYLKELAASGRTVVVTVCQPTSDIFHLIDDLILLSEGQLLYCGLALESMQYFEQLGFECPRHFNPTDFYITSVFHG